MSKPLGNAELCLALSENTINYQLQLQWNAKHIQHEWGVLVRQDKVLLQADNNDTFQEALKNWKETHAKLSDLLKQGNVDAFNVEKEKSKENIWQFGWTAQVSAPTIEIQEKETNLLHYNIHFVGGEMFSAGTVDMDEFKADLLTVSLKDCVYSFAVPLGKRSITSAGEINQGFPAREEIEKLIQSKFSDFQIEGLFLDFNNASTSNYDSVKSKIPEGADALLIANVEAYFKNLNQPNDHSNDQLLGYTITKKAVDPVSDSTLYKPSALTVNTSFSKAPGLSSLNFLMMTSGDIPNQPSFGVMDVPPLERLTTKESDVDGVLLMNIHPFSEKILYEIVPAMRKAMTRQFPEFPPTDAYNVGYKEVFTNVDFTEIGVFYHLHDTKKVGQNVSFLNNFVNGTLEVTFTTDIDLYITCFKYQELKTQDWLDTKSGKGKQSVQKVVLKLDSNGQLISNFESSAAILDRSQPPTGADNYRTWQPFLDRYNEKLVEAVEFEKYMAEAYETDIKPMFQQQRPLTDSSIVLPFGKIYSYKGLGVDLQDGLVLATVGYAPVVQ